MTFDAHANFAGGIVTVAPSPAIAGLTMTVSPAAGVVLPATPFNAVVAPASVAPSAAVAEIVRVTNVASGVWTMARAQEGSSARTILVSDQVLVGFTAKVLTDIETTANAAAISQIPVALKATPYSANANEFVPVDAASGTIAITLPTAPPDKTRIGVKKIDASANLVTITRGGTDVFNKAGGSTSVSLTYQNQGSQFQYEAATGIWYVVAADLGLTALDTRYSPFSEAAARVAADALLVVRSQPFTAQAPLELFYDSATFNGTLDPILKIGSNARGLSAQSNCYLGIEGDYNDGVNHLHEVYLHYDSADKTTVTTFRPLYIAIRKNNNANHAATIVWDLGTDGNAAGSSFAIKAGATTLMSISDAGLFMGTAFTAKIGTNFIKSMPTTVQASVYSPPWGASGFASVVTANRLFIVAINVDLPTFITGVQMSNDSVVSGNVKVAMYDATGATLLASSGSVVQTGTFGMQPVPFTSGYAAQPGTYFIAMMIDNATGKFFTCNAAASSSFATPGSFVIPSSITAPAQTARQGNCPVMTSY